VTLLLPSAAYIRKHRVADLDKLRSAGVFRSLTLRKVWDLLETPHTLESLQRAADNEVPIDRYRIEQCMKRLLETDLIELSPDS